MAPFPSVPGGVGIATDVFGGGNGFAIGKNAPDEAVDFLRFLTNKENNAKYAATGNIIPTVKGADVALKDPNARTGEGPGGQGRLFPAVSRPVLPARGRRRGQRLRPGHPGQVPATPAQAAAAIQKAYDENK